MNTGSSSTSNTWAMRSISPRILPHGLRPGGQSCRGRKAHRPPRALGRWTIAGQRSTTLANLLPAAGRSASQVTDELPLGAQPVLDVAALAPAALLEEVVRQPGDLGPRGAA